MVAHPDLPHTNVLSLISLTSTLVGNSSFGEFSFGSMWVLATSSNTTLIAKRKMEAFTPMNQPIENMLIMEESKA